MARKLRRLGILTAMLSVAVVSNGNGTAAGAGPSPLCTTTGAPSTSKSVVVPHVISATLNTCADETPPSQPCSLGADQSGAVALSVYECNPSISLPGAVPTPQVPGGGGGGGTSPPPGSAGTSGSSSSPADAGATPPPAAPGPHGQATGAKPAGQPASAPRAVIRSMRLSANRRRIAVVVQCASATQICNTRLTVYVGSRRVTKTLGSAITPSASMYYGFSLTPAGIRAVRRGTALRGVAVTSSSYGQAHSTLVLRVKVAKRR
jgi:hypothetical protein